VDLWVLLMVVRPSDAFVCIEIMVLPSSPASEWYLWWVFLFGYVS
jgi:hypothetical protein